MKKVTLISLCLFFSYSAISQTWKELNDSLLNYLKTGEYQKGIIVGEKAVIAARLEFGETHELYATSLYNLAYLYQKAGEYTKAEPLYIKVLPIWKETLGIYHQLYSTALNNLAVVYTNTGQSPKAEPLYIEAIGLRKRIWGETDPEYATNINNLAVLYSEMGQYVKAEPLFSEALAIRKKELGENHPQYAESLNNLAGFYEILGLYAKAGPLYNEALNIRKKILGENHPDYALSLNNLAGLYSKIGQYAKAEPLYLEALAIRKKELGENHPDYALSLNNLAVLYRHMGQYLKMEPLYLESISILKKTRGENHPDYATGLNNLAGFYKDMLQYDKAEKLYAEAISIRKKTLGEIHPDYATSLNNLAYLYQKSREYAKAESLFIDAIAVWKKAFGENHPDYISGQNSLAMLYQNLGQYAKAEAPMLQNSQIILKNLLNDFTLLSEKEKRNYISNIISRVETNNSFLYNYNNASPSFIRNNFNQQFIFKSLILSDTRSILASLQQSNDTAVKKVFNEWQACKVILSRQYALPLLNRRTDLKQIENSTENLERQLNAKSPEFHSQQNTVRISLNDIQASLQKDEAAIEFVSFPLYNKEWTDSIIYAAYILRKNDSVPSFIPLCEGRQLQKLFAGSGKITTVLINSFYRGAGSDEDNISISKGDSLYKLIWQPLEPYLKGINKISYSPAGKLYTIAFNALPIGNGKILMDKYQLQQYTSTRQIAMRNNVKETATPKSIALFGDATFSMDSLQLVKNLHNQPNNLSVSTNIYTPQIRGGVNSVWHNLPGTAVEVKKIQQLFAENKITTKTYIQENANEENLKTLSGNSPQILHIATHGFFLPEPDKKRNEIIDANVYSLADDPLMRSGILLSGANYAWSGKIPITGVEDGIATAYEISQLDLGKTELVVLSACETALGDIKGSEGVFGLQRAFKMAGVNKLIVSLWQVPDKETSELMTMFYSNWLGGKTIETAFYSAQAEMRKKYLPFYWAAFVLVE